jgi:hypothetical protein
LVLDEAAMKQIAGLKSLRRLTLPPFRPTARARSSVGDGVLLQLPRLAALKELMIGPLPDNFDLSAFSSVERLTLRLDIERPPTAWPEWRLPPNLKSLHIQGNPENSPSGRNRPKRTDRGLETLADLKHLDSLVIDAPIRLLGRGLDPLGHLEHFTAITLNVEESTAEGLASLRALNRLEY